MISIPMYKVMIRIAITFETILILDTIIEFILLLAYLQEEEVIIIMNSFTILFLFLRVFLLCWTYLRYRFRGCFLCMKSTIAIFIIIMNSFKTLLISEINEDMSLGLLFANTIIINILCLVLEAFSYFVIILKIQHHMKSPSKKDSTVRTKKNSRPPFNYQQLANTMNSKEKEITDQMKLKRVLYILGDPTTLDNLGISNNSKIITTENKDEVEEVLNDIVK